MKLLCETEGASESRCTSGHQGKHVLLTHTSVKDANHHYLWCSHWFYNLEWWSWLARATSDHLKDSCLYCFALLLASPPMPLTLQLEEDSQAKTWYVCLSLNKSTQAGWKASESLISAHRLAAISCWLAALLSTVYTSLLSLDKVRCCKQRNPGNLSAKTRGRSMAFTWKSFKHWGSFLLLALNSTKVDCFYCVFWHVGFQHPATDSNPSHTSISCHRVLLWENQELALLCRHSKATATWGKGLGGICFITHPEREASAAVPGSRSFHPQPPVLLRTASGLLDAYFTRH